MGIATGFTAARMLEIENNTIIDADVDADGYLILTRKDGTSFSAGHVAGENGQNGTDADPALASVPGEVRLDSFPGADDDEILDNAMAFAKVQPRRPSIRMGNRDYYFNRTHNPYSAFRLLGPGVGWQNPEIAGTSSSLVPARINLGPGIGIEETSLFVALETTYNVTLKGLTFYGTGVQQVYHHDFDADPDGSTCYAGRFDSLTFYAIKHALGSPAKGMSITLCHFTGEWTNVGVTGTQYTLRGSDNWLWMSGVLNYGWKKTDGGDYLVRFDNLSKTFVANMYLTARGGVRCLIINGTSSSQGSLVIRDSVFEGQNLNDPAMGALIKQFGGKTTLRDCSINFFMANPALYTDAKDKAAIECAGGYMLITGGYSARANQPTTTLAVTAPLVSVYKTGKVRVKDWLGVKGSSVNEWSELPIVRQAFAGQGVVDDTLQLVIPPYLRRTTGVGPGSQAVTFANSAPGGTAWDEIVLVAPSIIRYTGGGDAVIFQPGTTTERSYLAWTDMEGATKQASIRSDFYITGAISSPHPLWQFRSPTNTQSYFGITIDANRKLGWSNDITGTATAAGVGVALAANTWYTMHAEINAATGTVDVEILDALGAVVSGGGFSLTGQDLGASNPDVIMGSVRFGRLGNYGTVGDFRMKNFAFQVNTNTVIPAP